MIHLSLVQNVYICIMKVTYNAFEMELLSCSMVNGYYNINSCIKLKNEMTDTDFCFSFKTKLNERDLQYVSDNIYDLINNNISSFGFKSCDKTLSFLFELKSDGVISQFEIWKFSSINTYCTYNINLETDVYFLEQLCTLLDIIKKSDSINVTAPISNDNTPLKIEIYKDEESKDYSLSLNSSENLIVRRNCLQQEDVDYLRSQIALLLAGDIISVNIESDNLFLSICSFGSDYMVNGEISDFTFPHCNKLKMYGGYLLEKDNIINIIR